MKKRRFLRGVCAGLVLTMALGLTACGGDKDAEGGKDKDGRNLANAALAKEYVYSEEPIALPDIGGEDYWARNLTRVGDKIYAVYEVYGNENQENSFKLLSMNLDGSDIQVKELQTVPGGVQTEKEETEGAEVSHDPVSDPPASADENLPADDKGIALVDTYEYTGLGNFAFSEDGSIYALKTYYFEDYSSEEYVSINKNYVCCWDADGVMLWESEIENLQTEESWSYVQNLVIVDGSILLVIGGDKTELMSVSTDGVFGERRELDQEAASLTNYSGLFAQEDGVVKYMYWDMDGASKMWMNTFDFNTLTLGEPTQVPDSMAVSGYNAVADGGDMADVVYTNSSGVYGINRGDTEPTQIMSFINSDVATTNFTNIVVLNETQFIGFYYDSYDGSTKCAIFTKVDPGDIKDKAVILISAGYLSYELRDRVVNFNKTNEDYRIVVRDYSAYSTLEDYMGSYTKLNNDILAEGMPDILVVDSNMPVDSYIKKGLAADIDKLIAEDEALSQEEFMQNVFEAYRVDGKLYYVIPSFNVRTVIGKTSVVGDRSTWTTAEMMELADTLPEGTQLIGELTRDYFLSLMLNYCGNDFVDVSTGKCAFNTEGFIDMLEFAKTLPTELNEEYYNDEYWMNYESQYRENRTVLMNCYLSYAREMNRYINGFFGEDINYIGFPTDSGQGSVVTADTRYMISSRTANMEGVWEFMRYYLTEEYQKAINYNFPVDKAVFLEKAQETMEAPYYLDENDQKVEYEDTIYINGQEITLPNMSQAQVDQFVAFVEGITKCSYINENVQNIILEEAASFFEGQKDAKSVADIIQSRVQVYVNENS